MGEEEIDVNRGEVVSSKEVLSLRESVGWEPGTEKVWAACISQSSCVVSARDRASGELLGIGFLVSNARHGQIVDLVVHQSVHRQGIGRRLVKELVSFAWENEVRYLALTWDETKPWLRQFYESEGFETIPNAMWHKQSLELQPPPPPDE